MSAFPIWQVVAVPLRIAFELETHYPRGDWWFEKLVDVAFAVEIACNFRTGAARPARTELATSCSRAPSLLTRR